MGMRPSNSNRGQGRPNVTNSELSCQSLCAQGLNRPCSLLMMLAGVAKRTNDLINAKEAASKKEVPEPTAYTTTRDHRIQRLQEFTHRFGGDNPEWQVMTFHGMWAIVQLGARLVYQNEQDIDHHSAHLFNNMQLPCKQPTAAIKQLCVDAQIPGWGRHMLQGFIWEAVQHCARLAQQDIPYVEKIACFQLPRPQVPTHHMVVRHQLV